MRGNKPKSRQTRKDRRVANDVSPAEKDRWCRELSYEGVYYHKCAPEKFGLTRESPIPNKTKCDAPPFNINDPETAQRMFEEGIRCGLVQRDIDGATLGRVWYVRDDGEVFEARLHDKGAQRFHGFPLLDDKDREKKENIKAIWEKRRDVPNV